MRARTPSGQCWNAILVYGRIFFKLFALACVFLFGSYDSFASPFYEYKIVAKSGDSAGGFTISSIKPNPSINVKGSVLSFDKLGWFLVKESRINRGVR